MAIFFKIIFGQFVKDHLGGKHWMHRNIQNYSFSDKFVKDDWVGVEGGRSCLILRPAATLKGLGWKSNGGGEGERGDK